MKWTTAAICLCISIIASAEATPKDIQWLGWPVTGFPWLMDEDILHPKDVSQFQSLADKRIRIGLRSDGVVVWEQIQNPQTSSKPKESDAQ